MLGLKDLEKFKRETGIKDDKVDGLITAKLPGAMGSGPTSICSNTTEETVDLSWIVDFVKALPKTDYRWPFRFATEPADPVSDKPDEDVFDSAWRVAPEALPAPQEKPEGE